MSKENLILFCASTNARTTIRGYITYSLSRNKGSKILYTLPKQEILHSMEAINTNTILVAGKKIT